jgi:flagellar biosynthesis protein FliR
MHMLLPVDFAIGFMLVFARTGSLVMLLPTLGERFIQVRIRLVFALFLTLLLLLPLKTSLPRVAPDAGGIFGLLFVEILIGLSIGIMVRILVQAADITSQFIAQSLGLSLGEILNPGYDSQSNALGIFMSLLVVTFIFVTDAHQAIITAIAASYRVLPPGTGYDVESFTQTGMATVGQSFLLAIQLAAPFFIFGLLFNAGLGLIARLMPQIQVTYLAIPLTILAGIGLLIVLLGMFANHLSDDILGLLGRLTGG